MSCQEHPNHSITLLESSVNVLLEVLIRMAPLILIYDQKTQDPAFRNEKSQFDLGLDPYVQIILYTGK
jgi:hypothetical protein